MTLNDILKTLEFRSPNISLKISASHILLPTEYLHLDTECYAKFSISKTEILMILQNHFHLQTFLSQVTEAPSSQIFAPKALDSSLCHSFTYSLPLLKINKAENPLYSPSKYFLNLLLNLLSLCLPQHALPANILYDLLIYRQFECLHFLAKIYAIRGKGILLFLFTNSTKMPKREANEYHLMSEQIKSYYLDYIFHYSTSAENRVWDLAVT